MFRALFTTASPASYTRALALALAVVMGCGAEHPAAPAAAGTGATSADAGSAAGTGGAGGAAVGTGGASGGGTAASAAAGGAAAELHGSFNVSLVAPIEETGSAAMTSIIGKVGDGPTPSPAAWQAGPAAAGCTLYTPRVLFCDPACDRSSACVDDSTCARYPTAVSVGTVTLSGIGTSDLTMDPIAGSYQPKAGTSLPYPPCTEGSPLELAAAGGSNPAFMLAARCIAPLEFSGPVALMDGQPLVLTWTAATQPDLARIAVELDISHHGGAKGKIECDVPDTGTLTIPAQLTDALVELGVAGFPSIKLTRLSSSAAGSGTTEHLSLNVSSLVERAVEIAGLVSCSDSSQCPSGQACQSDLTCK